MKFAITGANGRMGKELIRLISLDKSNQVYPVAKNPKKTQYYLDKCIENVDVVIDFTTPASSLEFANICLQAGKPMVSGTTGFTDEQIMQLDKASRYTPILWSPNMSIGINLLMKLAQKSAHILGKSFDIEIIESHHRNKVDSPSGTALMVGEAIANVKGKKLADIKDINRHNTIGPRKDESIGFSSIRAGNIAGTLDIMFADESEMIELKHQAMSRELYAKGALQAADWLLKQPPGKLYHTQDMLHNLS